MSLRRSARAPKSDEPSISPVAVASAGADAAASTSEPQESPLRLKRKRTGESPVAAAASNGVGTPTPAASTATEEATGSPTASAAGTPTSSGRTRGKGRARGRGSRGPYRKSNRVGKPIDVASVAAANAAAAAGGGASGSATPQDFTPAPEGGEVYDDAYGDEYPPEEMYEEETMTSARTFDTPAAAGAAASGVLLPTSTAHVGPTDTQGKALDLYLHRKQTEEEFVADEDNELWLSPQEREQLGVVLKAFMPALLEATLPTPAAKEMKHAAATTKTVERPFATLAQALDGREVKLRDLRTHVSALRKASLVASKQTLDMEAKQQLETQQRAHTLLISLVDSIASARRSDADELRADVRSRSSAAIKQEEADLLDVKPAAARKVALHMMLPHGHYFTSAAEVSASELHVGCADIVSVAPLPSEARGTAPTLGSRTLKAAPRKTRIPPTEEQHRPVAHLYYGAYASFAPTYDTTEATLSLGASSLLWQDKRRERDTLRARGWGDVKSETSLTEIVEPPAPLDGDVEMDEAEPSSKSFGLKDFVDLHPELDAAQLKAAYEELENQEEIDTQLHDSAALLRQLQELQEKRLRGAFGNSGAEADKPSALEALVARQVLEGLSDLLKLRPTAVRVDAEGQATRFNLIPSSSRLRAAAHSAAIDPALLVGDAFSAAVDPGYWGTLDEAIHGPEAARRRKIVQDAAAPLGRPSSLVGPPVIADNETVRLAPAAEIETARVLNARTSLVGAAPLTTLDGKKADLLARVAESRAYTQDDAHDKGLPPRFVRVGAPQKAVSGGAAVQVRPSVPQQATPGAHPMKVGTPLPKIQQTQQATQQRPINGAPATQSYATPNAVNRPTLGFYAGASSQQSPGPGWSSTVAPQATPNRTPIGAAAARPAAGGAIMAMNLPPSHPSHPQHALWLQQQQGRR